MITAVMSDIHSYPAPIVLYSLLFCQCTGAGSTNWQAVHVFTASHTSAFETVASFHWAKYNMCFILNVQKLCRYAVWAQLRFLHYLATTVVLSVVGQLCCCLTSVTSTTSPYSLTRSTIILNRLCCSISLAVLVVAVPSLSGHLMSISKHWRELCGCNRIFSQHPRLCQQISHCRCFDCLLQFL